MIRSLLPSDFDAILKVINDAAQAYKGVIPNDRWKEPYMSAEELKEEIEAGVRFFGWVEGGHLLGVTGIQALKDTTLIRHAYVLPRCQRKGTGTRLLEYLLSRDSGNFGRDLGRCHLGYSILRETWFQTGVGQGKG